MSKLANLKGDYNSRLRAIGANVNKWRERTGTTQLQLADAIDASMTHISMLESSTRTPGIKTILKIADVTEMSVDQLLTPPQEDE